MKSPYLTALAASMYIVAVVSLISHLQYIVDKTLEPILAPIVMLSLLVVSVAVMAYLFFYQPFCLFMNGQRAYAGQFFIRTVLTFALLTVVLVLLVAKYSNYIPASFFPPQAIRPGA